MASVQSWLKNVDEILVYCTAYVIGKIASQVNKKLLLGTIFHCPYLILLFWLNHFQENDMKLIVKEDYNLDSLSLMNISHLSGQEASDTLHSIEQGKLYSLNSSLNSSMGYIYIISYPIYAHFGIRLQQVASGDLIRYYIHKEYFLRDLKLLVATLSFPINIYTFEHQLSVQMFFGFESPRMKEKFCYICELLIDEMKFRYIFNVVSRHSHNINRAGRSIESLNVLAVDEGIYEGTMI